MQYAPTLPAGGYALLHGLRFRQETSGGRMLVRPTLPAGGYARSHNKKPSPDSLHAKGPGLFLEAKTFPADRHPSLFVTDKPCAHWQSLSTGFILFTYKAKLLIWNEGAYICR